MYKLLRSFLFFFDPEKVHYFSMRWLRRIAKKPAGARYLKKNFTPEKDAPFTIFNIQFPNKVGLAAGFDKNAEYLHELELLGFGFVETGTVTPKPQPGNDKPRVFRLPKDKALVNRMGFNNDGATAVAARIKEYRNRYPASKMIIGGNIGKNKVTPNEEAWKDYEICFKALHNCVDYFVVNVSSPNTPGLRELQDKEPLTALLKHVMKLNSAKEKPKPVLLKIAPDLTNEQLSEIVEIVKEVKLTGIIATNTTISRQGLTTATDVVKEQGGLSGLPVKSRSTEVIRYLRQLAGKDLVIIGVGGIFTSEDAKEKLDAGADLLQVYTGFIYEGPGMIKSILKGL